jgi:hypothetical protein
MTPRIQALRSLLSDLEAETRAIHDEASQGTVSTDDAVVLGVLLHRAMRKASGAIEPLKTTLREAAVDEANGAPGPRYFTAPDGSKCTVVIPKTTLSIRKGLDVEDLRSELGKDFDAFFDTKIKYVPRKNFQKVAATHHLAKAAMAAVDFTDGTPRVSFKD